MLLPVHTSIGYSMRGAYSMWELTSELVKMVLLLLPLLLLLLHHHNQCVEGNSQPQRHIHILCLRQVTPCR